MNTPILNRAAQLPADGWYEIETSGEHLNPQAGVVQLLDGQAFDSIVNRFKAEAAQPNFGGLLIDRDHFSLDPDQTSESFGWLMEMRNRDGHLEGRPDWTDVGKPAIEGKRFKFFSTVYDPADVEKIGERKIKNHSYPLVRPLRLDRLALTNDPNNKGAKPISNRQTAATAERSESKPTMKSVLKLLGLAEDASEESAVAALQKIQNRASQVETLTTEKAALVTERDSLLGAQVEADLEKYKAVIKNRDAVKKQLLANRAGTIEFLEALHEAPAEAARERITNRATAAAPGSKEAEKEAAKKADDASKAQRITNRAHEIVRQKTTGKRAYSFTAAFNEAETEIAGAAK